MVSALVAVGLAAVEERVAVELPLRLDVQQIDQGREDVERAGGVVAYFPLDLTRRLDEQRDPQDEVLVPILDPTGEPWWRDVDAVVGRHHQRAVVPCAGRLHLLDHLADQLVHRGDLHGLLCVHLGEDPACPGEPSPGRFFGSHVPVLATPHGVSW